MKNGSVLLAEALQREGVETFFYLMGAPMLQVENTCIKLGMQAVDVRHEQSSVMAAHAYSRLTQKPVACICGSGPELTNMITGLAHAMVDCIPLLALGGACASDQLELGVFQEIDQLALVRPSVKWCARVQHAERIPEFVNRALRIAYSGKPGPVYLDIPADILEQFVNAETVVTPTPFVSIERSTPAASERELDLVLDELSKAKRPIILSGSGAVWSKSGERLRHFVEQAGIPIYTTPQGRGVVPEDSELCYLGARSTAFREADLVLVLGTRMNYIFGHVAPPRFGGQARIVRIDIEPQEIAGSLTVDVGIVSDLGEAIDGLRRKADLRTLNERFREWRNRLSAAHAEKSVKFEQKLSNISTPIHPLRLCKEVRDFMDRDSILVVDGQEILNYARSAIPTFELGHRLNSGTFGTMGVGMPFGVGAKIAAPDKQVIVLNGDGSFGMNLMEFDTAVRFNLPILVVISLNGGWTADPKGERPGVKLGYTRYDQIATALGGYGEYVVENPDDIRPALERAAEALKSGKPALVNVVTDWKARAPTVEFTRYMT